jgi:putative ABC transport system permease protein
MTLGLIRGEAARDLRTLAATGATSRTRRALSATTAGALAVRDVTLGGTGAHAALLAGHALDLGHLAHTRSRTSPPSPSGSPSSPPSASRTLAGREPPGLRSVAIE